jgi:hypothetical protein
VIQALVRRHQCRSLWLSKIDQRRSSSGLIQRSWRGYMGRLAVAVQLREVQDDVEVRRLGAVTLQSLFRSRVARAWFVGQRRSVVKIQNTWRMSQSRRALLAVKMSVIKIQSLVRRHQRSLLLDLLHARRSAINIQKSWRKRASLHRYRILRIGVVYQQALSRGVRVRRHLGFWYFAALEVQRVWRGQKSRRSTMALRSQKISASIIIQLVARRWIRRLNHQRQFAAGRIQNNWRSYQVLAGYRVIKVCSTTIQTAYRRYYCQKAYARILKAVVVLQSMGRHVAVHNSFRTKQTAAVTIQAHWRSHLRRRLIAAGGMELLSDRKSAAASLIQGEWREYHSLKTLSTRSKAAVLLMSFSRRGTTKGSSRRRSVVLRRMAALLIQVQWRVYMRRNWKARIEKDAAAGKLQKLVKSLVAQALVDRTDAEASIIQDAHISRQQHMTTPDATEDGVSSRPTPAYIAARLVQCAFRCFLAKRAFPVMRHILHSAARRIQVAYLTWQMELTLLNVQSSVVLLQRSVRGQLVRSATRFALDNMNTCIRANASTSFGRIVAESNGNKALCSSWTHAVDMARESACIVIQSAARRFLAEQQCVADYRRKRGSALSPLGLSFGWPFSRSSKRISPRSITPKAHQYIQEIAPMTPPQSSHITLVAEDIPNSSHISARAVPNTIYQIEATFQGSSSESDKRSMRQVAATKIQATTRGLLSRCRSNSYKASIVKLQAFVRQYVAVYQLQTAKFSCTQIQRTWRGNRCRSASWKLTNAAVTIQAKVRAFATKRDLERRRVTVHRIQTRFKAYMEGKIKRTAYLKVLHAALFIQTFVRRVRAMAIFAKMKCSITITQAISRGVAARITYKRLMAEKVVRDAERLRPMVEMMIMSDVVNHAHDSLSNLLSEGVDYMGPSPPCVLRLTARVNALPSAANLLDASPVMARRAVEIASVPMLDLKLTPQREKQGTPKSSNASAAGSSTACRRPGIEDADSGVAKAQTHLKIPRLKVPRLLTHKPLTKEFPLRATNQTFFGTIPTAPGDQDTVELARAAQLLLKEARATLHKTPNQLEDKSTKMASPLVSPNENPEQAPKNAEEVFDSKLFGDNEDNMPSPIKPSASVEPWDWAEQWT